MNTKHTWVWVILAATLFAFIFLFERHWRKPAPGPTPILPGLKAAAISSVLVSPTGQFDIRVERTNGSWFLTKPIAYPAQAAHIETLLAALELLTPAGPTITASQLRHRPKAEVEFGFENPQASIVLQQNKDQHKIQLGAFTAPGDQVFLRVIGLEDIYVVNADLLRLVPRTTNDWRSTGFVDLRSPAFDHLVITNAANVIEFQRENTNSPWRMTRPMRARADNHRLKTSLDQLQTLPVTQFITDDPGAELETFGLQPAELELLFANGTNAVARLFFGKTNGAGQFFARREGLPGVVTVPTEPLLSWRAPFSDFRDRHLFSLPKTFGPVEVRGADQFTLLPQTNGWRMTPAEVPLDPEMPSNFLTTLAAIEIEFFQNIATEPDLRTNGLVSSAHEITLKLPANGETNEVLARLAFGVTNDHKVMVARAGEDSIYAMKLEDFQQLPWASWQLRERRIWNFSENDVVRVTTRQTGKSREMTRLGTNSWTLAPGSQGIINSFAIEETAHGFGELSATFWVERGAKDLTRYGITTNSLTLTFELRNGGKFTISFGDLAPSHYPYAAVMLGQETWVFEFPLALYQYVSTYLTPTSSTP